MANTEKVRLTQRKHINELTNAGDFCFDSGGRVIMACPVYALVFLCTLMSPNTIFGADGAAIAQFYGISLHKTFAELDVKLCAEGLGNIAIVLRAVNSHGKLLEALKAIQDLNPFDFQPPIKYSEKVGEMVRAAIQSAEEQLECRTK